LFKGFRCCGALLDQSRILLGHFIHLASALLISSTPIACSPLAFAI
jgi:hypothetical protein